MKKVFLIIIAIFFLGASAGVLLLPLLNGQNRYVNYLNYLTWGNNIDIECGKGINKSKVRVVFENEMALIENRTPNQLPNILKVTKNKVIRKTIFQDGKLISDIPYDYGKQRLTVYYDGDTIGTLVHFRTNEYHVHTYEIILLKNDGAVQIEGGIYGPDRKINYLEKITHSSKQPSSNLIYARPVYDAVKNASDSLKNRKPDISDSIWVYNTLKNHPYPYDTILKGGYHIKHLVYKEKEYGSFVQSLYLYKNTVMIKELGSFSFGMPYKNIGYVVADFQNSFVMCYSYGGGNPHMMELVDKKTGKILKEGTWVDTHEEQQILLYIQDEHKDSEQLKLYDEQLNTEIDVNDFNESTCVKSKVGALRDCVKIDTVTNEFIVLKTDLNIELKKTYKRY